MTASPWLLGAPLWAVNVVTVTVSWKSCVHPWPYSGAGWVNVLVLVVVVAHTVVPFENVQPDGVGGPPLATAVDAPARVLRRPRQHSSSPS